MMEAILDVWVWGKGTGPGMPEKLYFDKGKDFDTPTVIDIVEKYGTQCIGLLIQIYLSEMDFVSITMLFLTQR